ncbi:helix-turn-helix domain-containing protein [Chromohalobacter canadensis]|uniref:helix-turn-helix domain-containing protein n=1 Tax=Chromohalobacter canadensis TaxID=141389 RepID=UPI0021BF2D95|nr:helix-turn-helix domain-containing protein [Chromohalobacter canadensis]MCT8469439.1 helix-turn-helix domain-containing protein [Chromohalobacter canadensis]MCT8472063.1 helix-turn-helix domain-containing protein [Chromohalobacter canadensis]MCT8499824.1 helix-turn-helix domain-containing protein [Chromohalobacter canadensis]
MTALAGIGLYSPQQAEKLIGVDAAKIRRWLLADDGKHGPLWHPEPEALGLEGTLSFKDLLEIRAVEQFRKHGVSLQTIRAALTNLSALMQRNYPLLHPQLVTDGKDVILRAMKDNGETAMTDLTKFQDVMAEVVAPSIKDRITFDASNNPIRWSPDPSDPDIVVDPKFAFGKPIILPSHMSTLALFQAYEAEDGDADAVARNLEITVDEVVRAVNFEKRIAAVEFLH